MFRRPTLAFLDLLNLTRWRTRTTTQACLGVVSNANLPVKLILDAGRRVLRVGVTDEAIFERLPALAAVWLMPSSSARRTKLPLRRVGRSTSADNL